jgi:diketogulonate reductase-like aldo/keto reductase
MPLLGFGTYQIPSTPEGESVVAEAISSGYRLLDCASFYKNEGSIGEVVKEIPRDSIYIVSKVWNDAIYKGPEAVRASCIKSISDLKCEYLDLFLVHWPVPGKHVEAYKELIRLKNDGFVRDIGISNYTIEDFEELMASGIEDKPVVNQIEINPFLNRKKTLSYFQTQGVLPMSFRGLRNATAFEHPVLIKIASDLGVTTAQVLGRWLVQQGICHIPKSMQTARIRSNGDIFSFSLGPDAMKQLDCLTDTASLSTFREHYLARIVRDTPLQVPSERLITIE